MDWTALYHGRPVCLSVTGFVVRMDGHGTAMPTRMRLLSRMTTMHSCRLEAGIGRRCRSQQRSVPTAGRNMAIKWFASVGPHVPGS